ncbi:hypothetical protein GUJ93_ZPchr0010g7772 [Zizania palustris]|uniref:Uncharacterized protein n=1 Tax=Zizania palustris TaxID=103762 RepID=A0A8J5W8Q8_ZIZPA|nr:hypothetical protein GUJ93_ZPchr0010g7772 [Zizania palustris]
MLLAAPLEPPFGRVVRAIGCVARAPARQYLHALSPRLSRMPPLAFAPDHLTPPCWPHRARPRCLSWPLASRVRSSVSVCLVHVPRGTRGLAGAGGEGARRVGGGGRGRRGAERVSTFHVARGDQRAREARGQGAQGLAGAGCGRRGGN